MWTDLVRAVARYDVTKYDDVLRCDVGEVCIAFEHILRRRAERDYRESVLHFVLRSQWSKDVKRPDIPNILRDG